MLCTLMTKIFEKHSPDNSLRDIRPIGNAGCFRDGFTTYETRKGRINVLFYEQHIGEGKYTSKIVTDMEV